MKNEEMNRTKDNILDFDNFRCKWTNNAPATTASTASNYIMKTDEPFTRTYRSYIKPREYGNFRWSFWHSNAVDTTWDDGSSSAANDIGGKWVIDAAFLADGGGEIDGGIAPGTAVPITFNGRSFKEVEPGEKFWSDSVSFNIPQGHYLAFTWTITAKSTGKVLPYNTETLLMSTYSASGICAEAEQNTAFVPTDNCMVLPNLIAYEKPVFRKICFLGDSITQGVRTKLDKHEYWVSKIADSLPNGYGIWNIGSGWSRAYDAASDGAWLFQAKQNDQVIICLVVNDIGTANRSYNELLADLTAIVDKLKENNPSCSIIMFTVPAFNFVEKQEKIWRAINDTIRKNPPKGVDRVFDIAEVLSMPSPQDNRIRPEYMSGPEDPHPNGLAGTAVAEAFLKWYLE